MSAHQYDQIHDDLEAPPKFKRKLVLRAPQYLGLLFLTILPVLAAFGVLGDGRRQIERRAGALVVRADVPTSARHGTAVEMQFALTLAGDEAGAKTATVEISAAFMERFHQVRTWPADARADADTFVIQPAIPVSDSETRVIVEITPEKIGRARGTVRVTADTGERVELPLETLIFP